MVVGGVHLGLGFPNQDYRVSLARLRIDAGPLARRLVGRMIDVAITQALPHSLRGEVVVHDERPQAG